MVERHKLDRESVLPGSASAASGDQVSNKKGFSEAQAETILTATLATPSCDRGDARDAGGAPAGPVDLRLHPARG